VYCVLKLLHFEHRESRFETQSTNQIICVVLLDTSLLYYLSQQGNKVEIRLKLIKLIFKKQRKSFKKYVICSCTKPYFSIRDIYWTKSVWVIY